MMKKEQSLKTDILGAYLKKLDPEGAYEIVIAEIDERSHAWLEHNGYIIDITADQFKELTNQPVIVEKTNFFWEISLKRLAIFHKIC